MVATPVLADDHAPPENVDSNVVVPVEQIACVPLNVPALGAVVIVIVAVLFEATLETQPFVIELIVIVVEPAFVIEVVEKEPVPASVTFIVCEEVPLFAPLRV